MTVDIHHDGPHSWATCSRCEWASSRWLTVRPDDWAKSVQQQADAHRERCVEGDDK